MLGRSLLPEREMRNKSGASSHGNLRHFYKAVCFLSSPSETWRKTGCGFSSYLIVTYPICFSAFLIICILCSFCIERVCESKEEDHFSLLEKSSSETWQWPKFLARSVWCCARWRSSRIILRGICAMARKLWEICKVLLIVPRVCWLVQL